MLVLLSLVAIVSAHLLPGLLVVRLLDVGRSREERFVFAGVLGGMVAALVYLVALVADWEPLFWILIGNLGLASLVVPSRRKVLPGWSFATVGALAGIWLAVAIPYLFTTGSLYRVDATGTLLLDQALQRDALFHIGITRSLEHGYPPALLSVAGTPVGYHVGYHLQLAAWSRYFGIDAADGLVRTGTLWQIALLIASAFALATRFTRDARARLLAPVLVMGAGLGFLFFFRASVDWWSLVFMDVTLVSIFLANPMLPALPLLFAALALFADYADGSGRGALAGSLLCSVSLLVVKMFVGAQLLAALGAAALVRPGQRRALAGAVATGLAALPFLAHTFLAAEGSNTAVGVRPLEIVRYSMEKLDLEPVVASLAAAGRLEPSLPDLAVAIGAAVLWLVGFAGLRLAGMRRGARDLAGDGALRRTMAWFVLIGIPVALVFRIAPAEAESLSRLEAQNDIVWFAAASGVLLWFWTAEALPRRLAWVLAVLVALPGTVQHFVYQAGLAPDRVAAERVFAARLARSLSPPDAVWLDPLDRARPSLLPYVAGRAVVYDPYVGYDYMFVGREQIDYRHHAVAQFWADADPAFRAWVLDHFEVDFLWQQGLPMAPLPGLEVLHASDSIQLFRVHPLALTRASLEGITTPDVIPMAGAGAPYFDDGWVRSGRTRELAPGEARLYLPRDAGRGLRLTLRVQPTHAGGILTVDGEAVEVPRGALRIELELPAREMRGLHAIAVAWRGAGPLVVYEILVDG